MEKQIKLLVIGGSAGSLSMVLKIIPLLRPAMKFAIILVFHRKRDEETTLIEVLATRTVFTVKEAEDKDDILPGVIYVAPSDYHLLVGKDKTISLDASEKINHSRPSIDVTFESAADAYGSSLACMPLSGANADGANGLAMAKEAGAYIVIQDPASAEVAYMPEQAIKKVATDWLLDEKNRQDLINHLCK